MVFDDRGAIRVGLDAWGAAQLGSVRRDDEEFEDQDVSLPLAVGLLGPPFGAYDALVWLLLQERSEQL